MELFISASLCFAFTKGRVASCFACISVVTACHVAYEFFTR
jgi:hypothetical protein